MFYLLEQGDDAPLDVGQQMLRNIGQDDARGGQSNKVDSPATAATPEAEVKAPEPTNASGAKPFRGMHRP